MMALNNPVTKDSTSVIIELAAFDSATGKYKTGLLYNTSGLVVESSLNGAAWASIGTLATMTEGTWASLGFKESSSPGIYQVGAPNAHWTTAGNRKYRIRVTSDDTVIGTPEVVGIPAGDVYASTLGTAANSAIANAVVAKELETLGTLVRSGAGTSGTIVLGGTTFNFTATSAGVLLTLAEA